MPMLHRWKRPALKMMAVATLIFLLALGLIQGLANPLYPPEKLVFVQNCGHNLQNEVQNNSQDRKIYFITPTYSRREQVAELTRYKTLSNFSSIFTLAIRSFITNNCFLPLTGTSKSVNFIAPPCKIILSQGHKLFYMYNCFSKLG